MDIMRLEAAARAIYETLAQAGHGPKAWPAHSPNAPHWQNLPPRWQMEFRLAAERAQEAQAGVEG